MNESTMTFNTQQIKGNESLAIQFYQREDCLIPTNGPDYRIYHWLDLEYAE